MKHSNLILFFILLASLVSLIRMPSSDDLLFHIKCGEWIINDQRLPSQDRITHSWPNHPVNHPYWLSEVIFAAGYLIFGETGPGIVNLILNLLTLSLFLLCFRIDEKSKTHPFLAATGALILTFFLIGYLDSGPMIIQALFFTLSLAILTYAKKNLRILWIFVPLQGVWVNAGPEFVFGLILFVSFTGVEAFWQKKQGGASLNFQTKILLLSTVATLINPHGMKGFIYPFEMILNDTTFAWHNSFPIFVIAAVFFSIQCLCRILERYNLSKRLVYFGIGGLVVCSILLGFGSITGQIFPESLSRRFGFKLNPLAIPLRGISFIQKAGIAGNSYTDPSLAGPVLWSGLRVAIDKRPFAYPQGYYDEFDSIQNDQKKFTDYLIRYKITNAILNPASKYSEKLVDYLSKDPAWALVYCDHLIMIFVLRNKNLSIVERFTLYDGLMEKWIREINLLLGPPALPDNPKLTARVFYREAKNLTIAGFVEDPVKELEYAVQLDPELADATLLASKLASLSGQHTKAVKELEKALAQNPDDERVLVDLAQDLIRESSRKGRERARQVLEKALLSNPKSSKVRNLLANLNLQENDLAGARSLLEETIAIDPGNDETKRLLQKVQELIAFNTMENLYKKGKELAKAGEHEQAVKMFTKAIASCDRYPEVHIAKADSLMALKQYKEASCIYTVALSLRPDDNYTIISLAKALVKSGDWRKGELLIQEFLKKEPNHPDAEEILAEADNASIDSLSEERKNGELKLEDRLHLVHALCRRSRWEEAVAVLTNSKEEEMRKEILAKVLFQWGHDLLMKKKVKEAIEKMESSVQLWPKFIKAHSFLGEIYLKNRSWDLAEIHFKEILKIDPASKEAQTGKALIYLGQAQKLSLKGEYEEAIKNLKTYIRLEPSSTERELYEKVLANWEEKYIGIKEEAYKLYQKGCESLEQGNWKEGIKDLEEARRLLPDSSPILFSLSQAYHKAGEYDKTMETLKYLTTLRPDIPDAHLNLASLYYSKKMLPEASLHYKEYLRLAPDGKYAQSVQNILSQIDKK